METTTREDREKYRKARERRQAADAAVAQIDQERRARRCPRAVALLDELREIEQRVRPWSDEERRVHRHILTVAMALRYEADITAIQADQIRAEVNA